MMAVTPASYRQKLHLLLDELPARELREVYHFAIFLRQQYAEERTARGVPTVPAEHLRSLIGLTEIGGDALRDTEALYQ